MLTTCTRVFEFDAGHRIVNHESKCKHLHGHRYKVEVTCQLPGERLDGLGRIIDFGEIKRVIGTWLDDHLDHNFILFSEDPLVKDYSVSVVFQEIHGRLPHIVPFNPTAENLVRHLFTNFVDLLRDHLPIVIKVKLWETPNCWAEYRKQEEE